MLALFPSTQVMLAGRLLFPQYSVRRGVLCFFLESHRSDEETERPLCWFDAGGLSADASSPYIPVGKRETWTYLCDDDRRSWNLVRVNGKPLVSFRPIRVFVSKGRVNIVLGS